MSREERSRREFVWRNGVLGFGVPLAIFVWSGVVVKELGWRGLWSVPSLVALLGGLPVCMAGGWIFGVVFWRMFGKGE